MGKATSFSLPPHDIRPAIFKLPPKLSRENRFRNQALRQQVALGSNKRNAETHGPERPPLAVQQRAIAVPSSPRKPLVIVVWTAEPLERARRRARR